MKGQIDFMSEIIVDNFAGGGGASIGIELETGKPVELAINHDPDAILMHKTNHPYTRHLCEDVFAVDPKKECGGKPVGLAWFSPDCKHFSKAKGSMPASKKIRGLSWVILRWAMDVQPRVIISENVEEIMTWGPLIEIKGKQHPDPERKGETFNGFIKMLSTGIESDHPAFLEACEFLSIDPAGKEAERLTAGIGYNVEYKVMKACDYGVPTSRKRFYMTARRDGGEIVWPEPTHGPGLLPYKTAADIIDWALPCPSIFDAAEEIKDKYGLKAVRPLADNTMKRIARGMDKFVIKNPEPFIVQVNHDGNHFRGQEISRPIQTVTAKNGYGVAAPVMNAIGQTGFTEDRSRAATEPVNTVVTKQEACITAAYMSKFYAGGYNGAGNSCNDPLSTITSWDHNALAGVFLAKYFGQGFGQSAEDPLHTITTKDREALTLAHVVKYKGDNLGQTADSPLQTATAGGGQFGAVITTIVKVPEDMDLKYWPKIRSMLNEYCGYDLKENELLVFLIGGVCYYIADIGLRMLTPRELYNAQGFPPDYVIESDYTGKPYPKTKQVARCGNSVCPPVAGVLVRANLPEMCGKRYRTVAEYESDIAV